MATAKKNTETVTVVKVTGFTIELTEAEALSLHALLCKVGGYDKKTSHRDNLSAIHHSLERCGFSTETAPRIGIGRIFSVENVQDIVIKDIDHD